MPYKGAWRREGNLRKTSLILFLMLWDVT